MSLSYRWAEANDVPAISEFIKLQFGPDSIQAASGRLESLFVRHPYGFHVAICSDDSGIVAIRCYLPFYLNSPRWFCGFPVDLMVAPDCRRKGISSHFMMMADERFKLTVSSGQSSLQEKVYRKCDGREIARFYRAFVVKNLALNGLTVKQQVRDLLSWGRWRLGGGRSGAVSRVAAAALNRYAEYIKDRLAPHELGVAADVEFVDWRYFNPFYRDCRLVKVEVGTVSGLVAYRQVGDEVQILDLFASADQRAAILSGAISALPGRCVTAVFAGDSLAKLFKEVGFIVRPHGARLLTSGPGAREQDLPVEADWLLYAGASDIALLDFPAGEQNDYQRSQLLYQE